MNLTVEEVREEYRLEGFEPRLPFGLCPRNDTLDFEEKTRAFYRPGGRLMIVAHRGDRNGVFPENSLEATENVISAGADAVETDVQMTLDRIPIVMHDTTLSRTTDADRYVGKPGFPDTDEICRWTFAQIRALRLKYPSGQVTEYLVPALSDQMLLCRGRAFLTLDKHDRFDWDRDIYPLVVKTGAFSSVMVPYTYTPERALRIHERMISDGGEASPFFADSRDDIRIDRSLSELSSLGMPLLLRGTEYRPEDDADWARRLCRINREGGKYYIETLSPAHDVAACWRRTAELGCGWLMGNRIYEQLAFARELYPDYRRT